jgi:hypothetical protein
VTLFLNVVDEMLVDFCLNHFVIGGGSYRVFSKAIVTTAAAEACAAISASLWLLISVK